ncbi:Glucan 1,3-beta-glucosidase [Talaromyces pinophilus]|nr:Glucan 1,3-beta-glucosidase [Talaromyces pinophilus]
MRLVFLLLGAFLPIGGWTATINLPPLPAWYNSDHLPLGLPQTAPDYMVDNQGNTHGVAPDKGSLNGPVTSQGKLDALLAAKKNRTTEKAARSSSFWMDSITHGQMPFAPEGYQFYRNVMDFGAMGDGVTDDTDAINLAVASISSTNASERCGESCGSTSTLGALVYFPPGTYMISSPIVQYYYTQFVGDPSDRPTIRGMQNFTGIALIDTDPYIPGGNGAEWYRHQNQFYRQIRNFVIDLTLMNWTNYDNGQEYVPTGIHWQVAQATSMQNIHFEMPVSTATETTTAVGIFMENGSGGFLSDLTFFGGNIGFRAGSQQYTARDLTFTSCLTAISMIWDWGFNWKSITVISCYIALDCTSYGGIGDQGTGSITVIVVLDNLLVENSASVVLISGGDTIFAGLISPSPDKPASLLNSTGDIFERSRPQYESYSASDFIIATANSISNDATGDQTTAINKLLAASVGKPVFFPAGIYLVEGTVFIPSGSIIVGEGWSQIMGTGPYFADEQDPQVMVQVGSAGDVGTVEISDMLFTVKGATAGAILMEWNIYADGAGTAGMWDSHFRVGGAYGTDLQMQDCPKSAESINKDCMAASMLLHLTSTSSGYFENVWAWVADHDIDEPAAGNTTTSAQIDIYGARGVLIESQGPVWFYGSSAEHSILYQYQLSDASEVYFGHMQTETPYFQPLPNASQPYTIGTFASDPTFTDCAPGAYCEEALALQVLSSSDVLIYTAGFYSFFQNYGQECLVDENCQLKLVETNFAQGLWLYNLFTIGAAEIISPDGGIPPVLQADNQNGYSTETSVWLPLALNGADIGSNTTNSSSGVVYLSPEIYVEPSPIVACWPPCTFVMPPSTMPSTTVFFIPPITTSLAIGSTTTTTTIDVPPVTTSVIQFANMPINAGQTPFTFNVTTSLKPPPFPIVVGGITTTIDPPAMFGPYIPPEVVSISGTPYAVFHSSVTVGSETLPIQQATTTEEITTISGIVVVIPAVTQTPLTENPPLPETMITLSGTVETFSEAQFGDLHTITTQTTVTTTLSDSSSTGSETTTTPPPVTQRAKAPRIVKRKPSRPAKPFARPLRAQPSAGLGDYCPASISLDPNEGQGDDDTIPSPPVTLVPVTVPGSVVIGGTAYPITSGSVSYSGSALQVPTDLPASTVEIISFGTTNLAITIYPSSTGVSASASGSGFIIPSPSATTTITSSTTSTSQSASPSQTSTVPTSTSTTLSPTATATAQVCLGLWTEATAREASYAYTAYLAGSQCDGVFITNGTIGTPEDVCNIAINNDSFEYCTGTATFENSGTSFFSDPSCGFEISLNGQSYEPQNIIASSNSNENPCSGVCSGSDASVQGMLLYSLPACN